MKEELDREQLINITMDDFYNAVKSLAPEDAPDRLERLVAGQKDMTISIAALSRLVVILHARLKHAQKKLEANQE